VIHATTLYDLVAPVYERILTPLHDLGISRATERALGAGPESVLDVGIGPGRGVALLSGNGRRVVGVDASRRMLRLADEHLAAERVRASLTRANALALPFRSGSFDAVVSTYLLDVLSDAEIPSVLTELVRVLSPGGRLVLGTMALPNKLTHQVWMAAYRALPELVGHSRPANPHPYIRAQPLRVLQEEHVKGWVGMRVLTMVKVGP
jgi:ubiquinone/menaquinone biosynthesis C-methylase UbiE